MDPVEGPLLELSDLALRYGTFQRLKGITLSLPPGRIGLLGRNGAGKSSLLKVLLGLIRPTSGSGKILGCDLAYAGPELRRLIGYMPEAEALVPGLRGAEYVALAGELYGMPKREAQRRARRGSVLSRTGGGPLPPTGGVFHRHETAVETGAGWSTTRRCCCLTSRPAVSTPPAATPCCGCCSPSAAPRQVLLLSTHLLGDVDRVCESVVILHQGEVLQQGSVASLRTRRQDRYRLQIEGDPDAFLRELALEGVRLLHDNGRESIAWRRRQRG